VCRKFAFRAKGLRAGEPHCTSAGDERTAHSLIVGGGIAAYKAAELVRLIRKEGGSVTCVLTEGGSHFVTPLTLAALSENPVHTTLWDLKNEVEMGHIQLSRQADLVVVCPATADLLARMAAGVADDLATTLLLATDKPVLAVPAMNVRMWGIRHAAQCRHAARRWRDRAGAGRRPDGLWRIRPRPPARTARDLAGDRRHVRPRRASARRPHIVVTAGPTHEPIDPVRYIANRSSGRRASPSPPPPRGGARVTLVAGPVQLPTPPGVTAWTWKPRARWPPRSRPRCPPTPP
jgi:phosphopantothenoylcysteine decarboxylase/phosphopantothenate--cysteine ligase